MEGLTIEFILFALICVIMSFSILIGLIQGFKKNVYKLCSTIIFWIVFWISAPLIKGKFILDNEALFTSITALLPAGSIDVSKHTTLMSFLIEMIANLAGIDVSILSDPAVENTIIAIIQSLIKIFYLIDLAIFYAIASAIIYAIFFKKYNKVTKKSVENLKKRQVNYIAKHGSEDKKLAKRIAKNEKTLKRKKIYKPLGMVSGFARGLLSSFLILCVVNSTINLLPDLTKKENITASNQENNTNQSLYDFILSYTGNNPTVKAAIDMIGEYQNSTLIKTTGIKIGNSYADDLFVDSIVSGKSKDYSFSIRKELNIIIQVAEKAFTLTNGFNVESVNWAALNDRQVKEVQDILLLLSDDDLINNLGTVMVGIAISMDALKDVLPSNISDYNLQNIKWGDELKTIATLVADVFSLGDLSTLDYLNLDTQKVSNIFTSLSNLQSINFLGYVGGSYAIKSLISGDENYLTDLTNIEETLATLAVEGKISGDIATFDDMYSTFVTLFSQLDLDKYKDDEGKITNFVTLLTSIDTQGYQSLISSIFETEFVTGILPNVLTIIKNKLIPAEYSSIINPNVLTSIQWKEEINSLLSIINELTEKGTKPFEKIETFEFAQLKGFSTETVVNSELLSYAMIKLFIDASKNQGILGGSVSEITNYISVPDYLTAPADQTTHKFASKWYGSAQNEYKDGELYIMLNTVKNCMSEMQSLNNPIESLPAILSRINSNELTNSDVLYYSIDKIIKQFPELLVIPVSETNQFSEYEVNGEKVANMVKKSSISSLVEIFTGSHEINGLKPLDLRELYVYFGVDEEGNVSEEPLEDDDPRIEQDGKHIVKLDLSIDKLFNVLTTYCDDNKDQDGLFSSGILRATISSVLLQNTGEFIVIPDNSNVINKENIVNKEEPLDVISQKECKALLGALAQLDLNIDSVMENPLNIVDSMKENEHGDLKPCVPLLLGYNSNTNTDNDYSLSSYSGILHATLSKYILDFANDESSSLNIVVPSEAINQNSTDNELINSSEAVDLIHSIVIIGTDIFDSNANQNDLVDSVINKVLDNEDALDSIIMRATLSKYLNDQNYNIAASSYDSNITSKNVITRKHMKDLVSAINAIKVAKEIDGEFTLETLLDVDTLTVGVLSKANKNNELSSSLLIRGILEDKISKNISIPSVAKDENDIISFDETNSLITSLSNLLDSECKVGEIGNNIKALNLNDLKSNKQSLTNSLIIRNELTKQLKTASSDIVIPTLAYEYENILSASEISNFIDVISLVLADENVSLTNININNITVSNVNNSYNNIEKENSSLIINATITKKLEGLQENDTITIPNNSYENDIIKYSEMKNLFNIVNEFCSSSQINNISLDDITINTLYNKVSSTSVENRSNIFVSTMSNKLAKVESIVIPLETYEDKQINYDELVKLLKVMDAVSKDKKINDSNLVDTDNLLETITSLDSSTGVFESIIFRATATKLMQDPTKFSALNIEKGDLGLEGTMVDIKNNDIEIITTEEFNKLHAVLKELTTKHSDKGNINSIFASLSIEDYSASASVMMESDIVRKEMSSTIKEEFDNNTSGLIFLENLYNKEVPGKIYIDKQELTNLFETMDIVNKHHPEMTDFNFSFDIDDNSFIYELSDEEIDLIFNSALISFNIRDHIVKSNNAVGEGAYFQGVLTLTQTINPNEINTLEDLNDETKYTYTTRNTDGKYSHIHDLVKSLMHLHENGYIEVVTNKEKYNDIEEYKDEKFILGITNDRILRDSLPSIIENVEKYNENTHIIGKGSQHYADNIPQNMSVEQSILYWQGDSSYVGEKPYWQFGELYHFIDFVSASNDIITETVVAEVSDDIDRMLASNLAHNSVEEFLTNEQILLVANPYLQYVANKEPLDYTTIPLDSNNLRDWESIEGQNYIDNFALAYVNIKTNIVME